MVQHEEKDGYHWREYPPGRRAVYGQTMVQTSTWFGCGAALTLFLALLGILFTEVASKQANTPQATDFSALSDLVGILVIASLIAGCIACVSWCARDIGTSSTLARVARDGAPHTAMPHPRQIASVTRPRCRESWWTLVVTAALTTVTALLMVVVLNSGPQGSLPIAVSFAVISVALWTLFYVVHRVLPTRHMRRREVIASHWTASDETSAWSASRARSQDVGTDKGKRHPTLTHGKVLSGIAAAIGILVYLASFVVVLVYKPSKFSPERELSQPQDLMALRVMWVLPIMFAAAVVPASSHGRIHRPLPGAGSAPGRYVGGRGRGRCGDPSASDRRNGCRSS